MPSSLREWGILAACLIVACLPGVIARYTTTSNMGSGEAWYEEKKSVFTPPPWVFKVVWPTIYIGLGIAMYSTVMLGAATSVLPALTVNLLLAAFWPIVFQKGHFKIAFGMILIMLLTLAWPLYILSESALTGSNGWSVFAFTTYAIYFGWLLFAAFLSFSFV